MLAILIGILKLAPRRLSFRINPFRVVDRRQNIIEYGHMSRAWRNLFFGRDRLALGYRSYHSLAFYYHPLALTLGYHPLALIYSLVLSLETSICNFV